MIQHRGPAYMERMHKMVGLEISVVEVSVVEVSVVEVSVVEVSVVEVSIVEISVVEVSVVEVQREIRGEYQTTRKADTVYEEEATLDRAELHTASAFLYLQRSKNLGETRVHWATIVVQSFNKGVYLARRLVTWELS